MSAPRRRSARLASASKAPTPASFPPSLSSLFEHEENALDNVAQSIDSIMSSPPPVPQTPSDSSPIKLPWSEMHPSRVHHTMGPPSSAMRLGFKDIKTASSGPFGAIQSTPTKIGPPSTPLEVTPVKPPKSEMHPSKVHITVQAPVSVARPAFAELQRAHGSREGSESRPVTPKKAGLPSSPFTFRFTRPATDMKLGPEAQKMMDELREEALKIKADLVAQRELEREEETVNGRKIAQPKGRAGRFSAAHISEFRKMDSIENHPSAFRAQQAKQLSPSKPALKRSPSKANLDDSEPVHTAKRAPPVSPTKSTSQTNVQPTSSAKRPRQGPSDDVATYRPVSRDGSFLPRPKSSGRDAPAGIPRSQSSLASLLTPTKSSLARAATTAKTPTSSLIRSPSKPTLSGLPKSVTTNNLQALESTSPVRDLPPHVQIRSPSSRFEKVKSILKGHKTAQTGPTKQKSAIPLPSEPFSKTPAPTRVEKELPPVPLTTPGRRIARPNFTPRSKHVAFASNSPSLFKSSIPRSTTKAAVGEVSYPTLDSVLTEDKSTGDVYYPDLSAHRPLPEPPATQTAEPVSPPAAPGTFTFRSDHTIEFGHVSPTGFGSSPGQSSLRQVRASINPTVKMPGSFPSFPPAAEVTSSSSPNKENEGPASLPAKIFPTVPHGMLNKKRHRVSTDEEDAEREAAERAAKKQRTQPVPEGDALLAPRLVAASAKKAHGAAGAGPSTSPKKPRPFGYGTPSPMKRKPVLSLSRLNMLARPKPRN